MFHLMEFWLIGEVLEKVLVGLPLVGLGIPLLGLLSLPVLGLAALPLLAVLAVPLLLGGLALLGVLALGGLAAVGVVGAGALIVGLPLYAYLVSYFNLDPSQLDLAFLWETVSGWFAQLVDLISGWF